jgi:hypothetical protein
MFRFIPLFVLFSLTGCLLQPTTALQFKSAIRGPSSITFESQLQVSDRQYVESVLANAFGTAGTSQEAYLEQMTLQRHEFGGACDGYEASDLNGNQEFLRARCFSGLRNNTKASANPARFSLTMQACDGLIATPDRFNFFLSKIYGASPVQAPTSATIQKAYGVFFREEAAEAVVVNGLRDMVRGESPTDGWKLIATALCVSPEWQVQ